MSDDRDRAARDFEYIPDREFREAEADRIAALEAALAACRAEQKTLKGHLMAAAVEVDNLRGGMRVAAEATDQMRSERDAARAETERYALLASVVTSQRLEGVEVSGEAAARLLAEQERDEARAERDAARAEIGRAVMDLRYWADPGHRVAEVRRAMLRAADRLDAAGRAVVPPGEAPV